MPINCLTFCYQWRAVLIDKDTGYEFPTRISRFLRDHYTVPAVYKWRIHGADKGNPEPIYVGETENLARRLQRVLTPSATRGGATNRRLKEVFAEATKKDARVFLDFIDFEPFELNGLVVQTSDLGDGFIRKAIENMVLCTERHRNHPILNKYVDPVDKATRELARLGMTARQVAEILKIVKTSKQDTLRKASGV